MLGLILLLTATLFSLVLAEDKLSRVFILLLTILTAGLMMVPPAGILLLIPLTIAHKIREYSLFMHTNLTSAIAVSFSLIHYFDKGVFIGTKELALMFSVLIAIIAAYGIMETNLKKFLIASNAAQILFVALDLSVGHAIGNPGILKTIQIFNYVIAGTLLYFGIGIIARNKEKVSDLMGSWFVSKQADAFTVIACLSLAGLPGFNIFVSEWALFTKAFTLSPVITLMGIFLAMMLFIMYYKITYYLLVGPGREQKKAPLKIALAGALAIACLILGIIPQIQYVILGGIA